MDRSMFKNSSKTKKPNKNTHTLYQLSTQVPVEKKKKKRTPHVEITLSTHHKQKLLGS